MTAGAATVAPCCKVAGCTRPVRARGMCINDYEKWRRNNPELIIDRVNMRMIEGLLPARVKQLALETEINMVTVQELLDKLHAEGRAHIGSYEPPNVTGAQFRPLWVAGPGKHARKPSKQERLEHHNQSQRNSYRRRQQKTVGWAGILGAAK